MKFADIPGLEEEKRLLKQAVANNHVSHGQLFFGKVGSGNLALALAFATYLNCESRDNDDACGRCASCIKMSRLVHPDVSFVFPVVSTKKFSGKDAVSSNYLPVWRNWVLKNPYASLNDWYNELDAENKQGNISKEESRNIIKALTLKSFESEYKVMMIWLPELMHSSAANGILKILEEPPEKTIFILVTCDYEKLLTTILSRTQLFKIKAFSEDDISEILVNSFSVGPDVAQKTAQMSEGSVSQALSLVFEQDLSNESLFAEWMRACWRRDFTELTKLTDTFHTIKKANQQSLFSQGLHLIQRGVLANHGIVKDEVVFSRKFVEALDFDKIERISQMLSKAGYHLERNANTKILFLSLSLNISEVLAS